MITCSLQETLSNQIHAVYLMVIPFKQHFCIKKVFLDFLYLTIKNLSHRLLVCSHPFTNLMNLSTQLGKVV